ncbi:MAG TPA: serine hydrolase [Candidatus Baltobacteraceae bacterium]|jgi:beta-lactamase class A
MLTQDAVLRAAERAGLTPRALVIKRLDSSDGPVIEIDPHRYLYPASMIKVPLSLATLALVQAGDLRLDDAYEVTQANMTANDKPSPMVPGYKARLRQIIGLAITISDNVATNMLYDIAGRERATQIVQQRYGLNDTAFYRKLSGSEPLIHDPAWDGVHRNVHSAGDSARLFESIARERVPFAHFLRETLGAQQFNNKLNAGLYPGDRFAHKTGDTDEVTHDGGILYTESGASYVLVVYTGLEGNDPNNARFGPFMAELRSEL